MDPGQIEVVDDKMAEILRQKSPAERIRIGFMLWTSAHDMLMAHSAQRALVMAPTPAAGADHRAYGHACPCAPRHADTAHWW